MLALLPLNMWKNLHQIKQLSKVAGWIQLCCFAEARVSYLLYNHN